MATDFSAVQDPNYSAYVDPNGVLQQTVTVTAAPYTPDLSTVDPTINAIVPYDVQSTRQCADSIANTWSLSSIVPASVTSIPILGGFISGVLGNTVTNVTGIYNSLVNGQGTLSNTYGVLLGSGATLGIPVSSGAAVGIQGPIAVSTNAIAVGAGQFVGVSKFILDLGIYAEALNYCATGQY